MIKQILFASALALLAGDCRETPAAERHPASDRSRVAQPVVLDDARLDMVYTRAANLKSASKSVISALVGIAVERGHLRDVRQLCRRYCQRKLAVSTQRVAPSQWRTS